MFMCVFGLGNAQSVRSTFFLVDPMGTVHVPPNSAKYRFLSKFGSHNTIHIFKNYFVTIFSAINFQFLADKQYLNSP